MISIATTYANVYCPWMGEQGENPQTVARDGFCINCGAYGHRPFTEHQQAAYEEDFAGYAADAQDHEIRATAAANPYLDCGEPHSGDDSDYNDAGQDQW